MFTYKEHMIRTAALTPTIVGVKLAADATATAIYAKILRAIIA